MSDSRRLAFGMVYDLHTLFITHRELKAKTPVDIKISEQTVTSFYGSFMNYGIGPESHGKLN